MDHALTAFALTPEQLSVVQPEKLIGVSFAAIAWCALPLAIGHSQFKKSM
jgi:hypothetical protein